jgi:hypothetical protein
VVDERFVTNQEVDVFGCARVSIRTNREPADNDVTNACLAKRVRRCSPRGENRFRDYVDEQAWIGFDHGHFSSTGDRDLRPNKHKLSMPQHPLNVDLFYREHIVSIRVVGRQAAWQPRDLGGCAIQVTCCDMIGDFPIAETRVHCR